VDYDYYNYTIDHSEMVAGPVLEIKVDKVIEAEDVEKGPIFVSGKGMPVGAKVR